MFRPTGLLVFHRLLRMLYWVRRSEFLVFLPAITLAGFWLGGERVLLLLALGLPLLFALTAAPMPPLIAAGSGSQQMARLLAAMDLFLPGLGPSGRLSACLILRFDDPDEVWGRHGRNAQIEVLARSMDRARGALRSGDLVAPWQGSGLCIALKPVRRLDLESLVQMSARLQEAISAPIPLGAAQIYLTASVGFCIAGRPMDLPTDLAGGVTGDALLEAAQTAADEACRHGPGAIRAYSPEMRRRFVVQSALREELQAGLENGEIRPHFQPQISTDTGEISGVEALARWHHPTRGCLTPSEFLPAIEGCDLTERLGEVMLLQSLTALAEWDRKGLRVPTIAVNFSGSELRNPCLPDRMKWELDRFDMTPDRLTVEILETVIAGSANDVVVANVAALAAMGCGIDLDDFGTGHASITAIRRFAVRRLKIDRSFITKVDQDREQQKMVSAILSLAERLGMQTLAEGVETPGEHAILAQLGCGHVQGYVLARPLPFAEATDWIERHKNRAGRLPRIGVR